MTALRATGTVSTEVYSSGSIKRFQIGPTANYIRFAFEGVEIDQVKEFQPPEEEDNINVEIQVIVVRNIRWRPAFPSIRAADPSSSWFARLTKLARRLGTRFEGH